METHEAIVTKVGSEHFLSLKIKDVDLNVPLTKDEPNEIKKAFNELIMHLKEEPFNFRMSEEKEGDLIYQVAKEYVTQLNKELDEIYELLKDYQLLKQKGNTKQEGSDFEL